METGSGDGVGDYDTGGRGGWGAGVVSSPGYLAAARSMGTRTRSFRSAVDLRGGVRERGGAGEEGVVRGRGGEGGKG